MIACFYLPQIGIAVERARMPLYHGVPLALATTTGVVNAVSNEARLTGITSGMAITGARSLCRNLIVLPYNRSNYEDAAEAVWDVLATASSRVEPLTPELCFIEIADVHATHDVEYLGKIVAERVGVTVQIGIGSSKLVAKQAAFADGTSPLVSVALGMEAVFLASVPLAGLDAIPPTVRDRLIRLGVVTLGDILRLPPRSLTSQFKEVARKLHQLAVGEDGDQVAPRWPPPSITYSVGFDDEVEHQNTLVAALTTCATKVAAHLSTQESYARHLSLCLTLSDNSTIVLKEQLRAATRSACDLTAAGVRLLRRSVLDQPVIAVHLIARGLGTGSGVQLTLLGDTDQTQELQAKRAATLEETVIYIRRLFGVRSVVSASTLVELRQIDLSLYPLGHRKRESVLVATNASSGAPVRFYRNRQTGRTKHQITQVQEEWSQTAWAWDKLLETQCYRVVTDPWGLHQLEQLGVEWMLSGTAD
jgi:nucleotidyltransferase/DNA polymerase involved in DNA repair